MALVHEIEWGAPAVEPRGDLRAKLAMLRKLGFVPESVDYYSDCPWIVDSMIAFDPATTGLVYVDFELMDVISLVVSQDNSCRFCYAASRAFLRFLGYAEDRIRRLEHNLLGAELDARQRLAIDYARRVSRANPIPSRADWQPLLDAGYAEDAIKEIAVIAALNVYYNRLATLPAIPTETLEHLGERGWSRLARPLIGWYMRSRRRRGRPEHLRPEERTGPFASAVEAVDGLPIAGLLRRVIDEAWGSTLLPKRTKALIAGVVARGLGCQRSEREARTLLVEDGLTDAAIDQILAHLSSPDLDPLQTEIAHLARETIWYRPAEIQRQARRLSDRLDRVAFLEFVGFASLANALCRLHAVADRHGETP